MKVAIVGASGQLGTELCGSCPPSVNLQAVSRSDMDVTDGAAVARVLEPLRPDLVINAAAYTRVDAAESDERTAYAVNADGPRNIASVLNALGTRLIHISTDFVFGGDRPTPYAVNAPTAPVNVYGHSKLEGERSAIQVLGPRVTILRTSWLYSGRGSNFVRTMLRAMASRDQLGVVYDQVGAPTWARSLAETIWEIARHPDMSGIHHWCDDGVASWYDFAVAIQEEALDRGLLTRQIPVRPVSTAQYPTPACRPAYSVLDKRPTAQALGRETDHWRCNLRRMLDGIVDE